MSKSFGIPEIKPASFTISPSTLAWVLGVAVYGLAAAMVLLLAPPVGMVLTLLAILLAGGILIFRRSFGRKDFQLAFDGESWHCSNWQQAMHLKAYYFLPGIISLQFVLSKNKSRRLLLFVDSLSAEQWRNIRRLCRGF